MIEQYGSVDFYFKEDVSTFRPTKVIAYVEGEYGFIPLIAGKSLESKKKPSVEILSKNQCVDAFNQFPKMLNPCWTLTQISSDTVTLAITNWHPMNIDLHSNPDMWTKAYPMIRDVLLGLKKHGCKALTFLTSMNMQQPDEKPELLFHAFQPHLKSPKELVLAPPAWIFPFVANRLGLESMVMCVTQDEGQFIDTDALKLVKGWFVALGYSYDNTRAKNTIQTIRNMEEQLNEQRWFSGDDEGGEWV